MRIEASLRSQATGRRNVAVGRGSNAATSRSEIPGVNGVTRLVGVSRTGFNVAGLDLELGADDVLEAYRPRR